VSQVRSAAEKNARRSARFIDDRTYRHLNVYHVLSFNESFFL
jgi:hypothetical protein